VRTIEVTSFAEVVMAPAAADAPIRPSASCSCRPKSCATKTPSCARAARAAPEMPWLLHSMMVHDAPVTPSRSRRTARASSAAATPQPRRSAMLTGQLSGAEGSVLDPVVAIRYTITLQPDQFATVDIVTGMTEQREAALHLIDKYQDRHLADRVFELAWTHSQVVLRQLNASEADAQLYGRLANAVIYPNAALRADAAT
jgi:hypothetical protein